MRKNLFKLQKDLWLHLSQRRKIQLIMVLLLMIASSFTEVISIGLVVPFLSALAEPEKLYEMPGLKNLWWSLGASNYEDLTFLLAIMFCIGALTAGIMRLILLWANTRLSYAIGADFSVEIYRRTLYQPYSIHIARNSSDIISGVITKTGLVINGISAVLTLISSIIITIALLSVIITINPIAILLMSGVFGCVYLLLIQLFKRRLNRDSEIIASESTFLIKTMQEGLGAIRDVLIDGSQEVYTKIYRKSDFRLRRAQGNTVILGHSPRHLVETIGIALIAIFAYKVATQSNEGFVTLVPVFGALVMGAQRILPVLQQVYSSWTLIQSNRIATEDVINLLSQSNKTLLSSNELLKFEQSIKFCNVSFRYGPNDPWILYKINFTIKKGQFIGIKGETGSGKSTLIDILMGLIQPTKGHIEIDGLVLNESNSRSWQKKISHVPQKIFLSDCSILENIAFGVPRNRIDLERVKDAVQRAQFNTAIDGFKDGYETIVGERGAKLSGGQLQRVGISRALYKNTDFLVFDEATSALDDQTELKLMGELLSSRAGVTIVMITHRSNALVDCNKIIEIKNGHII